MRRIMRIVPQAMHDHAADNIRYIREAMERAGSFTSIPGWGGFIVGWTAIGATALAQRFAATDVRRWLWTWLFEALVATAIGLVAMVWKARRAGNSLTSAPARRFFFSYFAPIIAGAALTIVLVHYGAMSALPSLWLLLYGASFVSSGAWSIRVVPFLGIGFMLLGLAAAPLPLPLANLVMGAGFGALHIIFGFIIARSYGG